MWQCVSIKTVLLGGEVYVPKDIAKPRDSQPPNEVAQRHLITVWFAITHVWSGLRQRSLRSFGYASLRCSARCRCAFIYRPELMKLIFHILCF